MAIPTSTEAKARTRRLVAAIETDATRFERAFSMVPRHLLDGSKWKGTTGSRRNIERIVELAPRPPDHRGPRVAVWRYLSGLDAIPGDEDARLQQCVAVRGIVCLHRRPYQPPSNFGIVFTLHAIARLFDRSARDVNAAAAMFESHNSLLALARTDGTRAYDLEELVVPAADGFFVCRPRFVGATRSPVAVARTWYADDQADTRRVSDAMAWRALLQRTMILNP